MEFTNVIPRPFARLLHRETAGERATGGAALAVSTISGSTFNAFAKSLTASLSSLSLLFVSELLSVFFIFFSFGLFPVLRTVRHLRQHELFWLMLLGLCSGIVGPLLLFSGIAHTTAVNAGFFGKMQIVFMLLLARFSLRESITTTHLWAMTCILAGVAFILFKGLTQGLTLQWGDLLIVASTLSYALGSIIFRAHLHKVDSHLALLFRSGIAVSFFFIVSPFIAHPFIAELHAMPAGLFPSLLGFAFFSRFLNSVTHYVALSRLRVTTVSLVSSLDIVGATFFSYLFLGETIGWYHYAGGALVIAGTSLLNLVGTLPDEKQLEEHLKQNVLASIQS